MGSALVWSCHMQNPPKRSLFIFGCRRRQKRPNIIRANYIHHWYHRNICGSQTKINRTAKFRQIPKDASALLVANTLEHATWLQASVGRTVWLWWLWPAHIWRIFWSGMYVKWCECECFNYFQIILILLWMWTLDHLGIAFGSEQAAPQLSPTYHQFRMGKGDHQASLCNHPSPSINRWICSPLKIIYPKISGPSGSPIFWPSTKTSQKKWKALVDQQPPLVLLNILDLCEKHRKQKRCPQPFNIFGFPRSWWIPCFLFYGPF